MMETPGYHNVVGSKTIRATVRLFAAFRERVGASSMTVEVDAPATVENIWREVALRCPSIEPLRPVTRFAVDGVYAEQGDVVRDGAEIAFFPPMSGGATSSRGGC